MIYNQELASKIAMYVKRLYNHYQTSQLVYHNLSHTQKVFGKMIDISLQYLLTEKETFILSAATWFHDCGHLFGPSTGHELRSVSIMKEHLETLGVEDSIIQPVRHCILSTNLPNNPDTLIAEILCDADLYHLGTDEFFITDELVKKEFELRNHIMPLDWDENTLSFLESHSYFTGYCRSLLKNGKLRNITLMQEKIKSKS